MLPGKISPSMMCADILRTESILKEFENNAVPYLHIDIMDGMFVPNYALGADYCKALKKATRIPLDIHLMVEKPEDKLEWFPFGAGDIVSVHAESTAHLQKALSAVRFRGGRPFVALCPATPLCVLEEVLDDIDGVLVMTVNPGFAGQKMVPGAPDKLRRVREFLDARGYAHVSIEADGNVSFQNAPLMRQNGADIFVAGTSSVFHPSVTVAEGLKLLNDCVR